MRRIALAVALLLIGALSLGAQTGKKVALVVGNGAYERIQTLRNPANDAADMAAALGRLGFTVISRNDLDRRQMRSLIDEFNRAIQGAEIALFYYSGHGVQLEGENYLVPVNAEVAVPGDVPEECVSLTRITARMNDAQAGTNVIILDACRDNPFRAVTKGIERGLAVVGQKPPESIIVYATAENEKAEDGEGRNGTFTTALLKHLSRPEAFTDLLFDVNAEVRTATANKQKPAIYQNLSRKVYLAGRQPPVASDIGRIQAPPPAPGSGPVFGAVTVVPGEVRFSFASAGTLSFLGRSVEVAAASTMPVTGLNPGDYEAVMSYADGNRETKSLRVESGGSVGVSFSYIPRGSLTVSSDPSGARVFVGGVERGQTPLTLRDLAPGYVEVTVKREGYEDISSQKLVEIGKTTQAAFVLKKLPERPALPAALGDLVLVPGGSFQMGSNEYSSEKPVHEVRVSDFYIGKYEVTQTLYQSVMGTNPSSFKGESLPVETVTWFDAVNFCNKLSVREGLKPAYTISGTNVSCDWSANGYRLPTEAEWEYAARGGQPGLRQNVKYAGSDDPGQVAWYSSNSGSKTHPVGQKAPNALGLYDMSGNVWEWCWDVYGGYGSGSQADPRGASSGGFRVARGGGWGYGAASLRSASRDSGDPGSGDIHAGVPACSPPLVR